MVSLSSSLDNQDQSLTRMPASPSMMAASPRTKPTASVVFFASLLIATTHAFAPLPPLSYSSAVLSTTRLGDPAGEGLPNGIQNHGSSSSSDTFSVAILGDLHIDPRKMEDYEQAKEQWHNILQQEGQRTRNQAIVSLGDLGESKHCDHNQDLPTELFSGTSVCHKLAADYMTSLGEPQGIPYEVIGGNHDLEGLDEFATDQENLDAMLQIHKKETPQFCRQIAEKTLLVGLSSTVFREAPYTSHEVTIDDQQMEWFQDVLEQHTAENGWKIFVFTHAPPNGSGLRVLQENHVVNGCCWLNHSDEAKCRKFIELVREHKSIKGWFSGHFHLGQDYQDSITFPTPENGVNPNRGACTFVQTAVLRAGTSRDGRQQSRLIRGNQEGFEILTVDHADGGALRLDATVTYNSDDSVSILSHQEHRFQHDDNEEYVKVPMPVEGDDGFLQDPLVKSEALVTENAVDEEDNKWWRLRNGRVLGISNGMLLEYDRSTLAPLGLVVSKDELVGKQIAVVDVDDPADPDAQAVLLVSTGEDAAVQVIQPNEDDGSYWRKIVRNKVARMQERKREQAAADFVQQRLSTNTDIQVQSTWGPYTTTSGTAKSTAVPLPSPKKKKKQRRAKKQQQQPPKPVVATSPSNLERILQEQSTVDDDDDEMYVLVSASDLQQVVQQRRIQANQAEIRRSAHRIPTTRFVEESPLFPRSTRQWAGRRS